MAINSTPSGGGGADGTVIDNDDRLLFTTRSLGQPFVGRCQWSPAGDGTVKSDVAEVAWFVRGRTLYRRVLLVAPWVPYQSMSSVTPLGFYNRNDVSVRRSGRRHRGQHAGRPDAPREPLRPRRARNAVRVARLGPARFATAAGVFGAGLGRRRDRARRGARDSQRSSTTGATIRIRRGAAATPIPAPRSPARASPKT